VTTNVTMTVAAVTTASPSVPAAVSASHGAAIATARAQGLGRLTGDRCQMQVVDTAHNAVMQQEEADEPEVRRARG
jgi:hypothetical protein